MKLLNVAISVFAIFVSSVSISHAGNWLFKHSDGSKIKLTCNNSGCFQTAVDSSGKKGKRTRIGPGGRSNFNKHKKALNAKGYK